MVNRGMTEGWALVDKPLLSVKVDEIVLRWHEFSLGILDKVLLSALHSRKSGAMAVRFRPGRFPASL